MFWMKAAGSGCILLSGGLAWYLRRRAGRQEMGLLLELSQILEQMASEIRTLQTPLPRLFRRAAQNRSPVAAQFLLDAAGHLERGEAPSSFWQSAVSELPVCAAGRAALSELGPYLDGGEERLCGGLVYGRNELLTLWQSRRDEQREREKRDGALCFSAAALTVIVLL